MLFSHTLLKHQFLHQCTHSHVDHVQIKWLVCTISVRYVRLIPEAKLPVDITGFVGCVTANKDSVAGVNPDVVFGVGGGSCAALGGSSAAGKPETSIRLIHHYHNDLLLLM